MTDIHIASTTSTVQANTASTHYFLDDGASITINSLLSGLVASGITTGRSFTIAGDIFSSGGSGMAAGDYSTHAGAADLLEIMATGSIKGLTGLAVYGDGQHVENAGAITGSGSSGLYINADQVEIVNTGSIEGATSGIGSVGENGVIINRGMIQSSDTGVLFEADSGTLINRGTISANHAINGLAMKDGARIVNYGAIHGSIELGGGDDIFENRGGTVSSTAYGGMGDDSYYVDSPKNLVIDEFADQGTDSVYTKSSWTLGADFENLFLTGKAHIDATGNKLANRITGNDAANLLKGAGGNDTIASNGGADVMKGGAGADIFLFETGDGHDRVADFGNGKDRIELDELDGITGFKDLMRHHVSVHGDDLVIASGDDQLVLAHTVRSDLQASDFIF